MMKGKDHWGLLDMINGRKSLKMRGGGRRIQ